MLNKTHLLQKETFKLKHYDDFPLDGTINQQIVCFHHLDKHHASPFHHHINHVELLLFLSGNVQFFSKKIVFKPHPFDLIIIPAGTWHRAYTLTATKYERIFINIQTTKIKELSTADTNLMQCFTKLPLKWDINVVHLDQTTANHFVNLCHQVIMMLGKNGFGVDINLNILQAELLLIANKAVHRKKAEEINPQPTKLQQLLDYIDTNLDHDLSLNHLANYFFLNPDYLNRYFRKEIGLSIHVYIKQSRLEKARRLLAEDETLSKTAQMCGYKNYSSFIRAFTETVGISPGKFRKLNIK